MNDIVERLMKFYRNARADQLADLDEIYHPELVFRDPISEIRGICHLQDYLQDMYRDLSECRFEYLDKLQGEGSAYIKWNMHYRHRKFGNKLITVRGVSQLQFGERVHYHEDLYDLGELIYEHVPLVGSATRWLKSRLSHHPAPARFQ